ncbi:glycosyltransferase family 2 protein [Marinomonas sp.]|uniref:glycosyltransferase family 2 protein n=1 Tax=Marinomonas sp. TaxID=1904862 RepID=UPI003BA9869E
MKNSYAFIIPAYNPDENLLKVVKNLQLSSSCEIIIINDGSHKNSDPIFDSLLNSFENIKIVNHEVNLGKGAAIKTAFSYILKIFQHIKGVVTLDSDGQHSSHDCMRVLKELESNPFSFVLGCRKFDSNIPIKSYIGNNISNLVYTLVLGRKFKDTQTGLRGLSKELMALSLDIESNGFEFETEQLVKFSNSKHEIEIIEIDIETIYIENNKSTSFRPLLDSLRIYFVLLRYGASSLITALVDFIIFSISLSMGSTILNANLISRTASIFVQFCLLNKMVFLTKAKVFTFLLFVLYVYSMGILSSWLQVELSNYVDSSQLISKLVVEFFLFFINFTFLKYFLFYRKDI